MCSCNWHFKEAADVHTTDKTSWFAIGLVAVSWYKVMEMSRFVACCKRLEVLCCKDTSMFCTNEVGIPSAVVITVRSSVMTFGELEICSRVVAADGDASQSSWKFAKQDVPCPAHTPARTAGSLGW